MVRLSERLLAVCSLVKVNSRIADIGTDHGFIPVWLYQNAVIKGGVASDVNIGPLNSCKRLVSQELLCEHIKVCQSDGLKNLCEDDFDTVIIAGMGGSLIADILADCPYIKNKYLVLNPMTHPEIVRKFLFDNAFEIDDDIVVKDGEHYYSVFSAHYSGVLRSVKRADYYLGNIKDFSNRQYFERLIRYLENKSKSGEDYSDVINAVKEKI